jgi:hypothetical protein
VHVASQAANIYGDEKSSLTYYVVSSFVAFALSGAYASSSTWPSYATWFLLFKSVQRENNCVRRWCAMRAVREARR